MLSLDEFSAVVRADAAEVARRSLRHKFGRLSNRRILGVLRPVADQVEILRGASDTELLDAWFDEFTRLRKEFARAS